MSQHLRCMFLMLPATGGSTTGGQQNERLTTLANTKTTGLSAGDTNIVCPSLKPAVVDLLVDERCSSCVK